MAMFGGGSQSVGVQASGIDKVVQDMETSITNLRNSVNAVDQACDEVRNGWKGSANDEFKKVMDDWSDESDQLNKKLDELSKAVDAGKKHLVNMDQGSFA
ncbi:WXG100 family type VII secretion target [Nocardia blacklockiae]|uniref:WXG100 family type VII secretion target n=1 Tax=Nocardia blacklockiae TaxID=480036 RepID=UPI0018942F25|nr:WXG100 family type VII secretion target [Nocardia blacklockiae]MBF6171397.1 WXG100 family type VII secretion target [Nocardia blacklockiae]